MPSTLATSKPLTSNFAVVKTIKCLAHQRKTEEWKDHPRSSSPTTLPTAGTTHVIGPILNQTIEFPPTTN